MSPTADSPAVPAPPAKPVVSGKWVILGILALAIVAASGSWWFRYNATHRSVEFWGPLTARLLRDAPIVQLVPAEQDVSSAKGLTHLRNALLEDRSFIWPATHVKSGIEWTKGLAFDGYPTDSNAVLMFSSDLHWVRIDGADRMLSCQPITAGLREMFAEFAKADASETDSPAAPAAEAASPNANATK